MVTDFHNTALLLFVRDEREEAQLKPLASTQRSSAALFRQFNAHAKRQACQTGLPLFVVKGRQQRGDTFGERLANAIESVFARGFQRVISLGNDCLQLQPQHILEADKKLQRHDLVVGPAADGGVYLLGIVRSAYHRQAFVDLPWQTEAVGAALQDYAGHCLLSKLEEDVDNWQDFQRQLGRIAGFLRKRLLTHLRQRMPVRSLEHSIPATQYQACVGLRAPPQ